MEEEDEESGGGGEGWLVSFADLMTLLFAAFVVLYGTLEVGQTERIFGYTAAIRESFIEVPDIIIEKDQQTEEIRAGKFVFKAFYGESTPKGPKQYVIKDDQKVSIDRDRGRVDTLLDKIALTEQGIDFGLRKAMNVVPNEKGFSIQLTGSYFFPASGYRFSREGRRRFITLGKLLKSMSRPIIIEGHTDSTVSKGEFDNAALGSLRAANAARVLSREVGMSNLLIDTVSYGPHRPIEPNDTWTGREKNRRIEIKISYK